MLYETIDSFSLWARYRQSPDLRFSVRHQHLSGCFRLLALEWEAETVYLEHGCGESNYEFRLWGLWEYDVEGE